MRIKICRKEAKESQVWLRLAETIESQEQERVLLIKEAIGLMKIFGKILENSK